MSKRKRKLKLETETIRVPADFKASLETHVAARGMTTVNVFRLHGPSILELIQTKQPAAQEAGAA